jgi:hypothetical protein
MVESCILPSSLGVMGCKMRGVLSRVFRLHVDKDAAIRFKNREVDYKAEIKRHGVNNKSYSQILSLCFRPILLLDPSVQPCGLVLY